jgi:A/G-specific adenine glycosylase
VSDQATFRAEVMAWGIDHARSFPWRESRDPYEVLVGEVLLQRTRGANVVPVYTEFIERWPTATALSRARLSTIERVIRPLGLSKRAVMLKRLADQLVKLGGVPLDSEGIAALPGAGPYIAHAVPIFTDDQDLPLVDWVIARVLRRYFGLQSTRRPNADQGLWDLAGVLARGGGARLLWLSTLDLAAELCRPNPRCEDCPLSARCQDAAARRVARVGGVA